MLDTLMSVDEAIFTRRTCRKFRKDPVSEETLTKIIDAARYAPSSCNLQLWDFVLVDDPETKAEVAEETRYVHLAPVSLSSPTATTTPARTTPGSRAPPPPSRT